MSNFSRTAQVNLDPPTQGDDAGYRLEFARGGSPVDISGWTITFTLKRDRPQSTPDLQVTANITDAAGGIAEIQLASADTQDLAGLYYYDIEVDTGNEIRTIMKGVVPFEQD